MTVAELHIAADHASFAGHFPGFPILPGAVLLDEALHEIARDRDFDLNEWQVTAVKFLARVHPGDVLTLEYSASTESTIHFSIRTAAAVAVSGTLGVVTERDVRHGD